MYPKLAKEFEEAKREVEEGDWLPEAEALFPRDLVIAAAKNAVERQTEQLIQDTRYLEPGERTDSIPVARSIRFMSGAQVSKTNRAWDEFEKIEGDFINAITLAILDYQIKYKAAIWRISDLTMPPYRSNRRKLVAAQIRFNKASLALHNYYLNLCTAASVVKGMQCDVYYEQEHIPRKSGLYFLLFGGKVVYIGRSDNLYNRLKNHDVVRKYYGQDDFVCGIIQMSSAEAKAIELDVIEIIRPVENVNGKT